MAKTRSISSAAMKILDRCQQLIYVLNEEGNIAFANQACLDWVGLNQAEIKSVPCIYSATPLADAAQNAIRGLCPPIRFGGTADGAPQENETQKRAGSAAIPQWVDEGQDSFAVFSHQGDQVVWRWAQFSRLLNDQQKITGAIVICGGRDQTSEESARREASLLGGLIDSGELHQLLAKLTSVQSSVQAINRERYRLDSLIGTSPHAIRLRRQTEAAIESESDLVIAGPKGAGREHLAKVIFYQRNQGGTSQLLDIHCMIADQSMIQSSIREFANSERGRRDWLLLLDVDGLNKTAQAELMGFARLPKFSLRTIATTTRSLTELSDAGEFDPELAHYLSTMVIQLSPLADRAEDVPLLAQALLEAGNRRRESALIGFSPAAMHLITEYDWPENIDQLKRVVDQGADKANGKKITQNDLPDWFASAISAHRAGRTNQVEIKLDEYLMEVEAELIRRAMLWAKGNKSKASKMLGISRPKLLRRLQLLGIDNSLGKKRKVEVVDASAFEEAD